LLIHNALAETTARHIVANEGLFAARPFSPAANPSQLLETTHLYPVPATFEDVGDELGIRSLARVASGNLDQAVRTELGRQRSFISLAEHNRREGKHLFNLTTHQKMIDVAIYDEVWAEATEHEHWQEDSGIGISRGVTTIEAFGMAASEVAQKIGHVFMSFPRTRTIMNLVKEFKERQVERLKQDPDAHYIDIEQLIGTSNRDMRGEIREWLGVNPSSRIHRLGRHAAGRYFNWAIEGATTLVEYGDNHRPNRIQLGKVAKGVVDVLKHGYSLPIVLWDQDDPIVEHGEATEVKNMADVAKIQEWQRATLALRLNLPDEAVTVEEIAT
jgi:hypothetical protein